MQKNMRSTTLRFYRQDMRIPFGKNAFDYVFNFFTSFGYFNDPDDDNKVVRNISTALKPGGLLVMDYINAVYAERRLTASEEKEIDGIVYHIRRWTDEKAHL
jgi:SAM-dependent methyltransferase